MNSINPNLAVKPYRRTTASAAHGLALLQAEATNVPDRANQFDLVLGLISCEQSGR
jgi:hypothetical protein